jgi:hypothetical protein
MLPPSSLPSWTGFNSLLLECLGDRLNEYADNRQPTAAMLAAFRERRDKTGFFPPDFQAQLMEEEIGADYFRVWQSLETRAFGVAHASLAELAGRGRLAAIITTNFDRLIEAALEDRGQAFEVFHDAAGFERLSSALRDSTSGALPIIKIHGSIEDTASLVDTLRQRVVGRPPALNAVLQLLLRRHFWLYLGFSGADFGYDPHYLGVLDAAAEAKGFVFLARPGSEVQKGIEDLKDAYGADKAAIVTGDLSAWPAATFQLSTAQTPATHETDTADKQTAVVRLRIGEWVKDLGPIAVVNIVCSMLNSVGLEREAFWLMRKTWKSYRNAEDMRSKSYGRYNYNYGMSLFDAGLIRNPLVRAEDGSNLAQWKEYADENAFEYLHRSYAEGPVLAAGGQLASLLAYRGELGRAMGLATEVTQEAVRRDSHMDLCDIGIASIVIYDIVQMFSAAADRLRRCIDLAKALGDEPRRAMLCAHLGRMLTYSRHFSEADAALEEADRIGRRLGLRRVLLATQAARGAWLADSGISVAQSVELLRATVDVLSELDEVPLVTKVNLNDPSLPRRELKGRQPTLCRVLLDLVRSALLARDWNALDPALDRLEVLTLDFFPGYHPHFGLQYAQYLMTIAPDKKEFIADVIGRAREVGKRSENPWVAKAADHLDQQLAHL